MLKTTAFLSLILCIHGYADICVKQNKSCSAQIWDNSTDVNKCQMLYYKTNSGECDLKEYKLRNSLTDFGYVKLEPYLDTRVARTVFNVTFYNIKWKYLKIRFKQIQFGPKCMCRDFYIAQEAIVPSHALLYYDCPWTDASYEGQVVNFEFEYGNSKESVGKKYTFIVPKHEELSNLLLHKYASLADLKLFLYVEQSNSRNLVLKIQVPPEEFQVEYLIVEVFRTRHNSTDKEDNRIVSMSEAKFGEIEFVYYTYGEHGEYFFTVKFDHPYCLENTCMVSHSPLIIIPKSSKVLTIGIVGVVGLIPVILIVLYIWRRQCLKQDTLYRANQSILLVPYPHNDANINVVTTLALLLKRTLKLNVMLDITDVSKFETKDPFDWYTTHFNIATHIVFLLSQEDLTTKQIVYKDIDKLAINLMKIELKSPTKQFSLVTFSYSQKTPDSLSTLTRFKFMREFSEFLNYLRKKPFLLRMEEKMDFVSDELYDQLRDAIKAAEKNMNFNKETIPRKSLDIICFKDEKYTSPAKQEFKSKPEKKETGDYLYKTNEMNLSGNYDKQDKKCKKMVQQSAFDGLAL
ncbi:hypothetical protein CBL_09561 [Carabus blaptoides fortunei]